MHTHSIKWSTVIQLIHAAALHASIRHSGADSVEVQALVLDPNERYTPSDLFAHLKAIRDAIGQIVDQGSALQQASDHGSQV